MWFFFFVGVGGWGLMGFGLVGRRRMGGRGWICWGGCERVGGCGSGVDIGWVGEKKKNLCRVIFSI